MKEIQLSLAKGRAISVMEVHDCPSGTIYVEGISSKGNVAHTTRLTKQEAVALGRLLMEIDTPELLGCCSTTREDRLRQALSRVRSSLLSAVNEGAISDTLWMDLSCPETVIDYIDSELEAGRDVRSLIV